MDFNYTAIFLIGMIPLLVGIIWYRRGNIILKSIGSTSVFFGTRPFSFKQVIIIYFFSLILVFAFMNVVIHQMGFYELFFTDIMKGSDSAQQIVDEFLAVYGDKHRHAGHGFFHGVINAFCFVLPLLVFYGFLDSKSIKETLFHFGYWLITCALVCTCIAEFV